MSNTEFDPMNYSPDWSDKYFKNSNGPLGIGFDVTTKCNCHCMHCYNNSGKPLKNELSDDEVIGVAKQIASFRPVYVCLCGGEPLLRKNIIDVVRELKPHCGCVNMVSNGYLANEHKLKELKDAGLYLIQFSLDGFDAFQHDSLRRLQGSFNSVVNAIKNAIKVGLNVVVSFSPNKLNYKTFVKYVEFCSSLGITNIRSMPLIPMGRGAAMGPLLLSSEDYVVYQQSIIKAKKLYPNINIEWGDPLDHIRRMRSNAQSGIYTYSMEIKANGNIGFSTYIPIFVGNVRKHTLQDYWRAGFDFIWRNDKIYNKIKHIEDIYDFDKFVPRPFSGEYIYMDLIDGTEEKIKEEV